MLSLIDFLMKVKAFYSSMGDSEPVVTEASAAEAYASAGYAETGSNPTPEAGAAVDQSAGEAAQASSTYGYGYSNVGDTNAYAGDPNSVLQQAHFSATGDSKPAGAAADANEASAGVGTTAAESTMVSDYNSSVNGGVVGAVANAVGLENGNALENADGSADEKQQADGYGVPFSFTFLLSMELSCFKFYFWTINSAVEVKVRGRTCRCIIYRQDLRHKWFIN